MTVTFTQVDGLYQAQFTAEGDFALQVVFAENEVDTLRVSRSLDGTNFDVVSKSRFSNCPVIQTQGVNAGDYIRLTTSQKPQSVTYKSLD